MVFLTLAVVAALETAPSPTVELTLTGTDGAPVSAAPRSLSDVARERREGRRAVGGFSAVETTVPREPIVLPDVTWEEETVEREPEVVPEAPPPVYVETYLPSWYGAGGRPHPRRHGSHVRPAFHGAPHPVVRPGPRPAVRPAPPRAFSPRAGAGVPVHAGRRPG